VFRRGDERYLPLYEAKMVHHFNHRFGDYAMKPEESESTALPDVSDELLADPKYVPTPRYWVPESDVEGRLEEYDGEGNLIWRWEKGWLLGWRDICRNTDERTVIASIIPKSGVADTFLLAFPNISTQKASCYLANLNAFVHDYAARQKVGGTHLKYHVFKQLPVLGPEEYGRETPWSKNSTWADWIQPRLLELVATSEDMSSYASECSQHNRSFSWSAQRRLAIRCELDAAYFHLYSISRRDAEYILERFSIVRRNDEALYGDFRTKLLILDIYDRMQAAIASGRPYETILDPPPADLRCCHPPRVA